jgi:outer membrane biogenesis lipoprotein LolB
MAKGIRLSMLFLFSLILVASLLLSGCSRYANEEQLTTLDETEAAAVAAEQKVSESEQTNAELKAKLAEKQEELKQAQEEKERIEASLAQ